MRKENKIGSPFINPTDILASPQQCFPLHSAFCRALLKLSKGHVVIVNQVCCFFMSVTLILRSELVALAISAELYRSDLV